MKPIPLKLVALSLAVMLSLTACGGSGEDPIENGADPLAEDTTAQGGAMQGGMAVTADVQPTTDASSVRGTVSFAAAEDSTVQITGTLRGVPPGEHGFHVHANPDCGNAGQAAGGHWNPDDTPHGAPDDAPSNRHAGDFGNVTASSDSTVTLDLEYSRSELGSLPGDFAQHAVMVHAGEDDLTSQPSGDAGDRIGCGVTQMGGM